MTSFHQGVCPLGISSPLAATIEATCKLQTLRYFTVAKWMELAPWSRLALRCTYFHYFSTQKSIFIQCNAGPLQPYQYPFFGLCLFVVLALHWIFALLVLGSFFFFLATVALYNSSYTFVLRCTSPYSLTLSIYQPIPPPGSIITHIRADENPWYPLGTWVEAPNSL